MSRLLQHPDPTHLNLLSLKTALKEDHQAAFTEVQSLPDDTFSKPFLLDACALHFLELFAQRQGRVDIDSCILANRLVLGLTEAKISPRFPSTDLDDAQTSQSSSSSSRKIDVGADVISSNSTSGVANTNTSLPGTTQAADIVRLQLSSRLNTIALLLKHRFEQFHDLHDIEESIILHRRAITLTRDNEPSKPSYIHALGSALELHFKHTGDVASISEAIECHREALRLIESADGLIGGHLPTAMSTATYLSSLGNAFQLRFRRTADPEDISNAISFQEQAVKLTPELHEELPSRLFSLTESLQLRFVHAGKGLESDLAKAIGLLRQAIELTPDEHPNIPLYLVVLGRALQIRPSDAGNLSIINEAIDVQRKATELASSASPNTSLYFSSLGGSLQNRFRLTNELGDITEAISFHRKAVELTQAGNPDMHPRLFALADALHSRYLRLGGLEYITEAVTHLRKAIELTPPDHPSLPAYFSLLGVSLQSRFQHTGEVGDISEAITSGEKAVHLTSNRHPSKAKFLSSLAGSFQRRFTHTGDLTDIAEAITHLSNAIQLSGNDSDTQTPLLLYSLANSLQRRFAHTREVGDITDAVSSARRAVELTPAGHPNKGLYCSLLSSTLQDRFLLTDSLDDASESISLAQQAVQLAPAGHPEMPLYLSKLGISFEIRYARTKEFKDLTEAVKAHRESIQLTPPGHPDMPVRLGALGTALQRQFALSKSLEEISESIAAHEAAVKLVPIGYPQYPVLQSALAFAYKSRFDHTAEKADIDMAICSLSLASKSSAGSPTIRLHAARFWIQFAQEHADSSQSFQAHEVAIRLISHVAGLEQTIEKRHHNLSIVDISTLSASAAAAALSSGRPDLALEWLEQGRCLVWNQLNYLRTPLVALRSHDTNLADELMRVSKHLDSAGIRTVSTNGETNAAQRLSLEEESLAHVKLAKQWHQLVEKVRRIPEFEDFLMPPSSSNILSQLPKTGVVIMINVHQDRCDAIALRSGCAPLHVPLAEMSYAKADGLRMALKTNLHTAGVRMRGDADGFELRRGMRFHEDTSLSRILAVLWSSLVKPILTALGHSEPPTQLLRIWWCATGPLAFLPIHAAGIYNEPTLTSASTLSEFAISSYIPTVRALIDIIKSPRKVDREKSGLLLISQPDTPGLPPIPGTTKESQIIEHQLKSFGMRVLTLTSAAATLDRTTESMQHYSCIHLACHAVQNPTKPLSSSFALYDGPLDLSTLIKHRQEGKDLAFLSACQTSSGDEQLAEEAVHLAAGMLAAGYRGAVATMWSIMDRYGAGVAGDFYANLIDTEGVAKGEALNGENAARALHFAVRNLRKLAGDSEAGLREWVPYVNFGL